jgi:putative oxidoreductase
MIREPDKYSLDHVLGIRLPTWIGPLGLAGILLAVRYTGVGTEEQQEEEEEEGAQDEAREKLAGEDS